MKRHLGLCVTLIFFAGCGVEEAPEGPNTDGDVVSGEGTANDGGKTVDGNPVLPEMLPDGEATIWDAQVLNDAPNDEPEAPQADADACPTRNACGGCMELIAKVGAKCGVCGTYACNGTDAVSCNDPGANACGGCNALPNQPGARCGTCGTYACNGTNAASCSDPGANACGGCSALPNQPGARCGTCGTYACNGTNAVSCNDPGANACGGCNALPNQPGARCGTCGTYACNGTNAVSCIDPVNACGGCSTLRAQPGTSCGTCGTYACNGTDSVTCNDPYVDPVITCEQAKNECGSVADGCGKTVSCGTCSVLQSCSTTRCACQRPDAVYAAAGTLVAPTGGVATSPNNRYTATVIRLRTTSGVEIRDQGVLLATLTYPPAGSITFDVVAVAWNAASSAFTVEVQVRYVTGSAVIFGFVAYEYTLAQLPNNTNPARSADFSSTRYLQMRYNASNSLYIDNDCVVPHSGATLQ